MTMTSETRSKAGITRYFVVAVLVVGAFFGAYQFAQARGNGQASPQTAAVAQDPSAIAAYPGAVSDPSAATGSGAGGSGCACCGSAAPTQGGVTGAASKGAATVNGDVQTISVDLSKGYYEPNTIQLEAGVPAEITFGQSSGCTGQVMSQDLNFFEDLTSGPKTVKLPALEKGEYSFSCGMQMVLGKIIVE